MKWLLTALACLLLWKLLIFIIWNVERVMFFRSVKSFSLKNDGHGEK